MRPQQIPRRMRSKCLLSLTVASALVCTDAWAQDYDLTVVGVWAEVNGVPIGSPLAPGLTGLQCPSEVCVQILVLGNKDYEIANGDVTIEILYQFNGGTWTLLGEIDVVRSEFDPPFWRGDRWPMDFVSQPNNCIEFGPTAIGEYRFQASLVYSLDEDSSNNTRISPTYSVDSVCPREGCYLLPNGRIFCPQELWEIDKRLLDPRMCELFPQLCPRDPFCERFPEICPYVGEVEVLFDNRINQLNLVISTKQGRLVTRMEELRSPIRIGRDTYNHSLRFFKMPTEQYYVTYWPSEKTRLNEELPFPIHVRRARDNIKGLPKTRRTPPQ